MKFVQTSLLAATLVASLAATVVVTAPTNEAQANESIRYRQYYSSWSYYPQRNYYYRSYLYRPTVSVKTYHHHYCIHYPTRPRYVYYYNPYRKVYWGRYDLEEKGYSMLDVNDQNGDLAAIPEGAFPPPGQMPLIPDADDDVKIDRIEKDDLPEYSVPKE